jgi:hypothetical protein
MQSEISVVKSAEVSVVNKNMSDLDQKILAARLRTDALSQSMIHARTQVHYT